MLWVARRVGIALVQLWLVASICFAALHVVPGDPAEVLLSEGGVAPDPAAVAQLRQQLGLDRPLLAQYASFIGGVAHGDLGNSMEDDYPVASEIADRLPRTLELILVAVLLAVVIGIPAATYAAIHRGGWFDRAASAVTALLQGVPVFVVGTLMVLLFAQSLHWMPAGGFVPFSQSVGGNLTLVAMPGVTIALGLAAVLFRMARASVLDVLERDFVRTARAKGISPRRVLVWHVLRNALTPVLTVLGLHMGALLGGTVLVEYVFNWPGLSSPLLEAVDARDYPMVMGIVLTVSALFLLISLVMDLLYALVDPRVRAG